MVIVNSGQSLDGKPCEFYLDETMKKNLDSVRERVKSGKWDSKIIVCGYSGVGKSHSVQFFARYLCPWFDHAYYCFTIDQFIEVCSTCPEYSSVVLDEAFDSMSSKVALSREFKKILAFLQIVRQRHLFIFLLLPNFFDLNKGVALYTTSLLIVCYTNDDGKRGFYAVFDRERKRNLYVYGHKMMDYAAAEPNIRGRVPAECIIDWEKYEKRKLEHLLSQMKEEEDIKSKPAVERDRLLAYCKEILGISVDRLKEIAIMRQATIYDAINRQKEGIIKRFKSSIEV